MSHVRTDEYINSHCDSDSLRRNCYSYRNRKMGDLNYDAHLLRSFWDAGQRFSGFLVSYCESVNSDWERIRLC